MKAGASESSIADICNNDGLGPVAAPLARAVTPKMPACRQYCGAAGEKVLQGGWSIDKQAFLPLTCANSGPNRSKWRVTVNSCPDGERGNVNTMCIALVF